MALTTDTLRALLIEYLGGDFGPAELERMRELRALDLGGDDPRTMQYLLDQRLPQ